MMLSCSWSPTMSSEAGNWEGSNILNKPRPLAEVATLVRTELTELEARLAAARETLYQRRSQRIWPGLDDKVLTSWNGLMLAAFAEAGRALDRDDYVQVAVDNATFLHETMRREDGRLLRTWKEGSAAKYNGYLEDYAYLADGLLALYQTTFEERWFVWARELADMMLDHFRDEENGGFYDTADDHEALLHRPKEMQDNATPSGNAMAATVMLALALYTGDGRYWDVAHEATSSMASAMARYPGGFAQWLTATTLILGQPREVAIAGDPAAADSQALLDTLFAAYRPDVVVAVGISEAAAAAVPLLAQRPQIDGRATAYVCRRFVCLQPVTDPEALARQLDE